MQLREKSLPDRALLEAADAAASAARACGARVFVNDRVDVARLAGLGTGVHLGEEDLPPEAARAILPPGAPIGVSTHDPEAAARAFAMRGRGLRRVRPGLREPDQDASAPPGASTRSAAWRRPRRSPSSPSAGSRSTGSTPSGTRERTPPR